MFVFILVDTSKCEMVAQKSCLACRPIVCGKLLIVCRDYQVDNVYFEVDQLVIWLKWLFHC